MTSALPPEQSASYSAIIDRILAQADLSTISAKRIRKGLQEEVDYDLTPQKQAITDLIMERFDKASSKQANGTSDTIPEPAPTTNGAAHAAAPTSPKKRKSSDDEVDELSEIEDTPPPKKAKKTKEPRTNGETESDAQIAARLQAELNSQSSRATRGGGSGAKRKTPAKKDKKAATKKKSAAKVHSDDDSEVEGAGGSPAPEKEKKGGFHKLMNLSEPLAALLNEPALSRPQTVKKIWAYVKERDMQDPNDKRQIVCDDAMRAVFKSDRIHMFTMNKILAQHLFPADEEEA